MKNMAVHAQNSRSLLKSITFRILVFCSDFTIIYLITHRLDAATGLVIATNLASTTLYFIHERIWNRISWGRTAPEAPHVELIQAFLNRKKGA